MKLKTYKIIIIIISILIIALLLFQVLKIQNVILKVIYKTTYMPYVKVYSEEYNVDKYLVLAIIKNESNFKVEAKSSKNAKGLMQLMNDTAEEVAGKLDIEYKEELLYDEKINIQLGTKYISELLEKYNGNYILAVITYNAGMGKVDKWIKEGVIKVDGSDIENIPYKETNNYVRKVLRDYKIYKYLYETQ